MCITLWVALSLPYAAPQPTSQPAVFTVGQAVESACEELDRSHQLGATLRQYCQAIPNHQRNCGWPREAVKGSIQRFVKEQFPATLRGHREVEEAVRFLAWCIGEIRPPPAESTADDTIRGTQDLVEEVLRATETELLRQAGAAGPKVREAIRSGASLPKECSCAG